MPNPKEALKNYEQEQKQRALERAIRNQKRVVEGTIDKENLKTEKGKLKQIQANMRKHLGDNPQLRRAYRREKVHGSTSKIDTPEFLRISNADKSNRNTVHAIQDDLNLIPIEHRDIIRSSVKEINIVSEGNSRYDRKKGIMHILENPEPGEVIHEVGHAIETKLDLYEREDFKNIVEDILKDKSLGDIFYDNVTFVDPIIRIESEKFVSEYQGHIYDFDMVKYINTGYLIEPKQLGDYFTEGYRIYVMNPDLLKEKDKRLYQFIDREL